MATNWMLAYILAQSVLFWGADNHHTRSADFQPAPYNMNGFEFYLQIIYSNLLQGIKPYLYLPI